MEASRQQAQAAAPRCWPADDEKHLFAESLRAMPREYCTSPTPIAGERNTDSARDAPRTCSFSSPLEQINYVLKAAAMCTRRRAAARGRNFISSNEDAFLVTSAPAT